MGRGIKDFDTFAPEFQVREFPDEWYTPQVISLKQGSLMKYSVVQWLADGRRGLSSDAMCKRFYGLPAGAGTDHPRDPSDFHRCVEFLQATGSFGKVALMRDVSPQWAALVQNWDSLYAIYVTELAEKTGYAKKTYAAMKEIFAKVTKNNQVEE